MKLLLHADISKLGYFGDVVEVTEGYARNYLLPQGLAVKPTESNLKAIAEERASKVAEREMARKRLVQSSEKVNGAEVSIIARANESGHLIGSVSEEDVGKALREAGYEVQTKHILMNEHIRMLGSHELKVRFAEDITASITVQVVGTEETAGESSNEQTTTDESD